MASLHLRAAIYSILLIAAATLLGSLSAGIMCRKRIFTAFFCFVGGGSLLDLSKMDVSLEELSEERSHGRAHWVLWVRSVVAFDNDHVCCTPYPLVR
jgi:hypothetical protein